MEKDEAMNPEIKINPMFSITVSHEAKLRELLRNITSIDLQLCAEASKEFMKLLRGEEGGEMLRQYVQSSPNCSELLQAWNLRQSKPGLSYIMSLINVILSHKDGVYRPNDVARVSISRVLDKFARLILEEKLADVYKELNSKESKGKNGALLLMASIVRRGSGLASDVAKSFNFKLPNFLKLAEYDKRRKNVEKIKRKISTRRSYVRFAMSFLEIGDTRLLRWVLQQKEMFSGVLRGLGNDEEETVVYVLSTLKDKVLVPESLVPVGLRSVLFGSVTLEQLINISGRDDGGDAAEVAKKVLFMVCIDPCNGLMPDLKATPFPLKGNHTRLLGVMKKLKATEIEFHKDLLLAIVRGRPSFGSAYLDEFPYNLEDHTSWFAAVSLAANLVCSVNAGLTFDFLDSQPSFDSSAVQNIIKCIGPRSFNRIVMNKGLLHSESHIQHGTLKLVLEALKLLDSLFSALNPKSESNKQIKQDIQNEVQLLLPDHQVLLSLISNLNNRFKNEDRSLKRGPTTVNSSNKKLKTRDLNDESDILIGGITSSPNDNQILEEDDNLNTDYRLIKDLWESHDLNMVAVDDEVYFYSKLLDALKVYHRTMSSVLEGSFDFFKILPNSALSLPTILQQSLLSLLVEHIGWSSKQDIPIKYPPQMYKHLMHFINLVVHSPIKEIRDQAYVLAQAAMLSTGAFDNNGHEINAWFLFIPGFSTKEEKGKTVQNLSSVVISFFCDVVSTVGNNLFKYWDLLRSQIHQLESNKDIYPRFSPLFICVLEKCLRLLSSESGTFNLPEKSMISTYVNNTLRYLLQTQVEAGLLSSLISVSLSNKLEDINDDLSEWNPLKSLLLFSRSITDTQSCIFSTADTKTGLDYDSFMKRAPFYEVFPAIMSIESPLLSESSSKLQGLLLTKLSNDISDNFVCSFRVVFFWFHQVQSSYRNKPVEKLVQISEICFALIKHMLERVSTDHYFQEIAETVFCHPVVVNAVEIPLSVNKKLKVNIFDHPTDSFLSLAKEGVHIMDFNVLQVLEIFCKRLFSDDFVHADKRITTVFNCFLQKLVVMLKNRFNRFIKSKNLVPMIPTLFGLYSLIRFVSPQELLELANWMFSKINFKDISVPEASRTSALCVGLNIAGFAFDLIPLHIQEIDIALFEEVYFHIVEIASHSELAVADLCLLKAVKIANKCNSQSQTPRFLPNHMVTSRIVANTPMSLISKCFEKPSMVKGQTLLTLTESSQLHLSFFGIRFMEMVNKFSADERSDDFLILLPTVLSFLDLISVRYGEKHDRINSIRSLYWEILSNGFSNFNTFVSKDIFQVKLEKSMPSDVKELCDVLNNNLLGKTVTVIQDHLLSNGPTVKRAKRLKLFDSVIPSGTDNLLDCNFLEIDHYSIDQCFNLIMKIVTKVRICKILLFSNLELMSNKEHMRSVTFINSLVSTWRSIVKKFPQKSNSQTEVNDTKHALFRLLEIFILRIFVEVITEMRINSDNNKSNSFINVEKLARSCLLHRFDDPATIGMLKFVTNFEYEDKSLNIQILQLLLAHSQFASMIQSANNFSNSVQFGIIFRPMSSILRSLTFEKTGHKSQTSDLYTKQLEIVKLLRVLCRFKAQDIGINVKELMFLLLSSYGATISEKDVEIYNIMQELENIDELYSGYIADMDYLWGTGAIRVRKIREIENNDSSSDDNDEIEKRRKSQFRENLPVDPRICADTVLHFPYDRKINSETVSSDKIPDDYTGHVSEAQTASIETRQIYDPVFIMRMSLHGLSMDYIEPIEYANLGLLAVAFISLSSPDEEIRKLGYKVLTVFRNALEISQRKKEVNRIRPLLTYVQNGINEAWQKIPSIHALFAAEASVLLLDPSNNHYKTVNNILLHSPMNTKMISFFDEFFWSNSVNFKSDRIWILRLLYSGINLEDDAQIYVRSSVLEKLLSFYTSSLSDNESKELILQIVKKCMKFEKTSKYLIEHCGVISWLSSLISNFCGSNYQEQRGVLLTQLAVIIKVVNDVVISRNTIQWMETHSVEQLTQLSCQLYVLFVDHFQVVKEVNSVDLILEVISSTLKISQNRDVLQPHFTFLVDGLYQLSQTVDTELGLKVVLMTTPQAALLTMDLEKLQKFVLWAVSIALKSDKQTNESLLSKLLRWLTASVILTESNENSFEKILESFLGAKRSFQGCEEVLAATIYYLQQIVERKCEVFTSVVSSLCVLLSHSFSLTDALPHEGSTLTSFLSRIRCPVEANPSWRWSFEQPWKDPLTKSCCVDEVQACQSILMVISNILGKKSSLSHFLSVLDVEYSGVFNFETSLVAETL